MLFDAAREQPKIRVLDASSAIGVSRAKESIMAEKTSEIAQQGERGLAHREPFFDEYGVAVRWLSGLRCFVD